MGRGKRMIITVIYECVYFYCHHIINMELRVITSNELERLKISGHIDNQRQGGVSGKIKHN
jgi:hypothetical protein